MWFRNEWRSLAAYGQSVHWKNVVQLTPLSNCNPETALTPDVDGWSIPLTDAPSAVEMTSSVGGIHAGCTVVAAIVVIIVVCVATTTTTTTTVVVVVVDVVVTVIVIMVIVIVVTVVVVIVRSTLSGYYSHAVHLRRVADQIRFPL
ncbi:conserved hypothetical protein [Trichinella spiralis]|uniref:hypothetical protein n=1 Tax=Trichinella spiralis TaxID=6334 RepID=UPI0001EFE05F|nr:conserved hypothetical protein [Trichinella spiralis]